MSRGDGRVELDRAVDSIRIGARHRRDLGDLDALCASIQRLGLLQPITITPDGVLVCGSRRLAAVTKLGWRTVRVWVRSGISTRVEHLLAERDENSIREPLAPSDAAALYEEFRALLAEDATQRRAATQFTTESTGELLTVAERGPVQWTGPQTPGAARLQAATIVTGSDSHTRLDRVLEVQHLAADPGTTLAVREIAKRELAAMDEDKTVASHYVTAMSAALLDQLSQIATDQNRSVEVREEAASWATTVAETAPLTSSQRLHLVTRARAALEHLGQDHRPSRQANPANAGSQAAGSKPDRQATGHRARPARSPEGSTVDHSPSADVPEEPGNRSVGRLRSPRAFKLLWGELAGWEQHYDPTVIGPALTAEHWQQFLQTVAATSHFAERAAEARQVR